MRTRLVFAFVVVTLGSMLAFGWFMYREASGLIDQGKTDQLESLAESNEDALRSIIQGWQERVSLVSSRTQLRVRLRDHYRDGGSDASVGIQRILDDAEASVRTIAALAVYDPRNRLVARAASAGDSVPAELSPRSTAGSEGEVHFLGLSFAVDGTPQVAYSTPLALDGRRVGYLYALLNADRLGDLADDYTGLGETGEVMIVAPHPSGAQTVHPVRHPTTDGERPPSVLLESEDDPALLVLDGLEGVRDRGIRDYRGKQVWAATRYLSELGWGLVVKSDTDERQAVIHEFRDTMFSLALTLAGIGAFVAVILGFLFARPIHSLAAVADRFGDGDLNARAVVEKEDEVGLLARTFNEMADDLQARLTELHEFQKFFDVSINLLCIAGTDGYFKRTNPAFEKALGWDREKLLSRPFLDLVHPDDVKATEDEIAKLAQGIPTISFVNRFRCADGSWKWLRWTSHPEDDLLYAIAREIEDPRDA